MPNSWLCALQIFFNKYFKYFQKKKIQLIEGKTHTHNHLADYKIKN